MEKAHLLSFANLAIQFNSSFFRAMIPKNWRIGCVKSHFLPRLNSIHILCQNRNNFPKLHNSPVTPVLLLIQSLLSKCFTLTLSLPLFADLLKGGYRWRALSHLSKFLPDRKLLIWQIIPKSIKTYLDLVKQAKQEKVSFILISISA